MSSPARVRETAPPELRFPFEHTIVTKDAATGEEHMETLAVVVSKDRIPFTGQEKQDYLCQGASLSGVPGQARRNCCWIEASMHLLMRDPYISYFVLDYTRRRETNQIAEKTALPSREYTGGAILMRVLWMRYKMRDAPALTYDNVIEPYYYELRNHFDSPNWKQGDGMGELDQFLTFQALPSLRTFIAFYWSGSVFQQHYLAYGCGPLVKWTESCGGKTGLCPLKNSDCIMYNSEGCALKDDPANNLVALNLTSYSAVIMMNSSKRTYQLSDLLGALDFPGKWEPKHGGQCSCGERRLVKKELVTLPWMLYINTSRPRESHNDSVLLYDPDALTVGPTVDGQYATYRLVARAWYRPMHYEAMVRRGQGQAWKKFSQLQQPTEERYEGEQRDTSSTMLVWERKE